VEEQASRPSEVLAKQLKHWRWDVRKLSAQDLANRLAELGAPTLNRRVISKIENGDRGVTLDEWLQLAHALAVPPPMLFLDFRSGCPIRIADKAIMHPWLAWEFVTGEEMPIVTDGGRAVVSRVDEYASAKSTIHLYRQQLKAVAAVRNTETAVNSAEYAKDRAALRAARSSHAEALQKLATVLDAMTEHGIQPPAMSPTWVSTMRELKMLKYPERVGLFEPQEADDGER
jgi:hypothetical protein